MSKLNNVLPPWSARRAIFGSVFFADKALQAEIDAGRDNGIQQRISTLLAENNQPQGSVWCWWGQALEMQD